jgi:hypothetical protein
MKKVSKPPTKNPIFSASKYQNTAMKIVKIPEFGQMPGDKVVRPKPAFQKSESEIGWTKTCIAAVLAYFRLVKIDVPGFRELKLAIAAQVIGDLLVIHKRPFRLQAVTKHLVDKRSRSYKDQ